MSYGGIKIKKLIFFIISFFWIAFLTACGRGQGNITENKNTIKDFKPQMDSSETVTLHVVSYMESFDALDIIVEDFQKYYPNFKIQYYYLDDYENNLEKCILGQENIDLYTVYPQYFKRSAIIADNAENLYEAGINLSEIETVVFRDCFYDGKLKEIPLALNTCGLVVNYSLLEQEGFSLPENLEQFKEVCNELVKLGYIPIQGNATPVYYSLMRSEYMVRLGKSEEASTIFAALNEGKKGSRKYLRENLELLAEFIEKGYIDSNVVDSYQDNYKQAALNFFEGNVPFLVTNLDTFSSMEKWERSSDTFSNMPFEYGFSYAPLGKDGFCSYIDAWTGFCVYENSANKEWANEFLRFFMTTKKLNKFAKAKGMPTISIDNMEDKRFQEFFRKRKDNIIYHGEIMVSEGLRQAYKTSVKQLGKGKITVEEALEKIENDVASAYNRQ